MQLSIEQKLKKLFKITFNTEVKSILALPGSGSARKYFRISTGIDSCIGVYNEDVSENEAFFSFTKHFRNLNLNAPELLAIDISRKLYLLQDLGDDTLFSKLLKSRNGNDISGDIAQIYKASLRELIRFQVVGGKEIDYSKCYPRDSFDRQSMQWDLNYFKYYFLKFNKVSFDEQKLEDDFHKLINFLLEEDRSFFMFRDFQSRNIMVNNGKPFFIDYQGGRKGPLQYDLVSLLFQAKADLPHEFRNELLEYYLSELEKINEFDKSRFVKFYYGFVLIRMLQVLGAYGYRGLFERKTHFLESINYGIRNIDWFVREVDLEIDLPELYNCLYLLVELNINDEKKR